MTIGHSFEPVLSLFSCGDWLLYIGVSFISAGLAMDVSVNLPLVGWNAAEGLDPLHVEEEFEWMDLCLVGRLISDKPFNKAAIRGRFIGPSILFLIWKWRKLMVISSYSPFHLWSLEIESSNRPFGTFGAFLWFLSYRSKAKLWMR